MKMRTIMISAWRILMTHFSWNLLKQANKPSIVLNAEVSTLVKRCRKKILRASRLVLLDDFEPKILIICNCLSKENNQTFFLFHSSRTLFMFSYIFSVSDLVLMRMWFEISSLCSVRFFFSLCAWWRCSSVFFDRFLY